MIRDMNTMKYVQMQRDYRMPRGGEGWRHADGSLWQIVAVAMNMDTNKIHVIYHDYGEARNNPPYYTLSLDAFLEMIEPGQLLFEFDRDVEEALAA